MRVSVFVITCAAIATTGCELPDGTIWKPNGSAQVQVDTRLYDIEKFLLYKQEPDPAEAPIERWVARVDSDRVTCQTATESGCAYSIRMTLAERSRGMGY